MQPASGALLLVLLATFQAAELPPADCVRLLRRARVEQMGQDPSKALATLREAVEKFPHEVIPVSALLEHLTQHGAAPDELSKLRQLLAARLADGEHPVPTGTLQYLMQVPDAQAEDLAPVLAAVVRRLESAPQDLELLEAQAVLNDRLGNTKEVQATLRKMLAIRPTPELHGQCLLVDRETGEWAEAVGHLRELVRMDPESPYLRMGYIEGLAKVGDYDELVRQLDHVTGRLDVLDVVARSTLYDVLLQAAWNLRDLGANDKAEAVFRRLLALDPNDADARQAVLYLYSNEEERRAHEASLKQKWEQESEPGALLEEGTRLFISGDVEAGFAMLQRAFAALPGSEVASVNYGLAAVRLERWPEAAEAFERAVKLNPDRAESLFHRGLALVRLQRFSEAIELLDRALVLQPDLFQAHFLLYQCHASLGNADKAQEHLARYKAAAPDPE
jgi:tetratricopeptide (TPR) repeat protein